jgi:hypothetical protein
VQEDQQKSIIYNADIFKLKREELIQLFIQLESKEKPELDVFTRYIFNKVIFDKIKIN